MTSQTHPQEVPELVERLRGLLAGKARRPWLIHSEPDVNYPPTIHTVSDHRLGGVGDPVEPFDRDDQLLVVEAVNALPTLIEALTKAAPSVEGDLRALLERLSHKHGSIVVSWMGDKLGYKARDIAWTAIETPPPVDASGAERICREAAEWELSQAEEPGIGKKAADNHRGAAHALEMAADKIAALAPPAPVAGNALDAGTVEACAKVADAYARGPIAQRVHGQNIARHLRALHGQSAGKPVGVEE